VLLRLVWWGVRAGSSEVLVMRLVG
jgi:hypothetical protein